MNAEFNKRGGITACIVIALIMLIFYSYLIGLDLGKCTTYIAGKSAAYLDNISWAHFSFDNFLDNCHRLVEFVVLYLIPMVLPWLLYFIFRPTTKIRYWLFVQMGVALFLFVAIPFFIVGVTMWCAVLTPLLRYIKVKFFGKEIEATVYGYMNDNVLINGSPAQIAKLLVQTNDGPKFILYQLGDIKQPYGIKTTLKLKVYKDIFLIVNKQQYYF